MRLLDVFSNYTNQDDKLVTIIYEYKTSNGYMPTFYELMVITKENENKLRNRVDKLSKRNKIKIIDSKDKWSMRLNV